MMQTNNNTTRILESYGLKRKQVTQDEKHSSPEVLNDELRHKFAVEMGHKGGTTTRDRYGHKHYLICGMKGGEVNKKNHERLAKYDSFFDKHPELFEIMEREEKKNK